MPHNPDLPELQAQEPTTSIGQTIDDQQPSRAKEFFKNPKNLATMLVLASALAQPKQRGQSNIAHILRGGVGSLAFRGGLDKQIHQQAQLDLEQQDVALARVRAADAQVEQASAATERNVVAREGIEADVGVAEAGITSQEKISQAKIDAGQFDKAPPASGPFFEKAMIQAQKDHSDAVLNYIGMGSKGERPSFGPFLLQAMQSAALVGGLSPKQLEFFEELTPPPTDKEEEIDTGGGDEDVDVVEPVAPTERDTRPSLVANKNFAKDLRGERTAQAKFLVGKNLEIFDRITSTEDVFARAAQIDEQVRTRLSTLSEEEAKNLLKLYRKILPKDTLTELRAVASGPITFPKTRN